MTNDPHVPLGQAPAPLREGHRFGWVTFAQVVLLAIAIGMAAYVAMQAFKPRLLPPAQGRTRLGGPSAARVNRPVGMRGMLRPDQKLVKSFDKNADNRLDAAERAAAREFLRNQGDGGRSREPGGFGRRGFNSTPPEPGMRLAPGDVRSYPGAPVYDLRTLRTVFLTFDNEDWEAELAAFYGSDVEVPATVIVDGKTYREVGVHFRGNSSYRMVPAGFKHSLNLSFDFVDSDQQLGGYRTLNLLNSNSDATFVRTVLYSEIARHYLPVPLTNYMRVVINGESWGVYQNVQQFNKDFLREWFNTSQGVRWKAPGSPRGRAGLEYLGEDPALYKSIYEIKTKDDPQSWAALIKLCRLLNQTPAERLEATLAPILDIDSTLKFLALDVALVNSDGYWTRASDYSMYQDERGKFHILPLDFNEAFGGDGGGFGGGGRRGGGGVDLDPLTGLYDASKPLRSKLLAVTALRARYLAYVRDIARRWLDWGTVAPLVRQWQALIESDVTVDTRKLYSTGAFHSDVGDDYDDASPAPENTLRGFIERRRAYLLR